MSSGRSTRGSGPSVRDDNGLLVERRVPRAMPPFDQCCQVLALDRFERVREVLPSVEPHLANLEARV